MHLLEELCSDSSAMCPTIINGTVAGLLARVQGGIGVQSKEFDSSKNWGNHRKPSFAYTKKFPFLYV